MDTGFCNRHLKPDEILNQDNGNLSENIRPYDTFKQPRVRVSNNSTNYPA